MTDPSEEKSPITNEMLMAYWAMMKEKGELYKIVLPSGTEITRAEVKARLERISETTYHDIISPRAFNRFREIDPIQTATPIPLVIYTGPDGKLTDMNDRRLGVKRTVIGEAFIKDQEITTMLGEEIGTEVLDAFYDGLPTKAFYSLGFPKFKEPATDILKFPLIDFDDAAEEAREQLDKIAPPVIKNIDNQGIFPIPEQFRVFMPDCTCPFNNTKVLPGFLPPHEEGCLYRLKKEFGASIKEDGCTCPWNNGYLKTGISGHHVDCPFLYGEHYPDDNCPKGPLGGHNDY